MALLCNPLHYTIYLSLLGVYVQNKSKKKGYYVIFVSTTKYAYKIAEKIAVVLSELEHALIPIFAKL